VCGYPVRKRVRKQSVSPISMPRARHGVGTGYRENDTGQQVLEALRCDRTEQQIAAKHRLYPTQVTSWKRQAIYDLTGVFSDKVKKAPPVHPEICLFTKFATAVR
jgi:hypothetical protein